VSKRELLLGLCLGVLPPICAQQKTPAPVSAPGTVPASLTPRRLAPENAYARVYCIVPMIGSGTTADPKRPMFAPPPPTAAAPLNREGIIAYQYQISDDGNFAIAEFVAVTRAGLSPILTSTNPSVISFERGLFALLEIETAFQQFKAGFSFKTFLPVRAL
jgi:hypothetical protein